MCPYVADLAMSLFDARFDFDEVSAKHNASTLSHIEKPAVPANEKIVNHAQRRSFADVDHDDGLEFCTNSILLLSEGDDNAASSSALADMLLTLMLSNTH